MRWHYDCVGYTAEMASLPKTFCAGCLKQRLWEIDTPNPRPPRTDPRELPLPPENDLSKWEVVVAVPDDGHVAHYCELQFEIDGIPYAICTTIESDGR